ncbi:hypothetical protein [Chryseobacterium taeanense]|nr:hypothetical protein [Chryseobacterium taeanense]
MVVKDVDKALHLFKNYFGFSIIANRNSKMAVLENNDQFALVIWGQVLNKKEDT